jgi:hypothetical protein
MYALETHSSCAGFVRQKRGKKIPSCVKYKMATSSSFFIQRAKQMQNGRFHRGGIIQGVPLIHNDPLENPEKIHGGVRLSH